MKFSIPTKSLAAALATLKPIAKPNTTHVILGNACITANKDTITLLGMDLEKQLTITLPATVKEKGSTTVPMNKLHESVSKMRSPDCAIESNEKNEMTVRSGSAVTKLLGLPMDELPQRIEVQEGEGITIEAKQFNAFMSSALIHANSDTDSRAIMCSVILQSRQGKLAFLASDFKHAIICSTEIPFEETQKFIVPRESVPAMCKLAEEGELELLFGQNTMSVKSEGMEFRTKLVEGMVPDFDSAIPTDRPQVITMNRDELNGIVEYAEIQTSEQASHIILACDGNTITARGAKVASATDGEFFDMNEDSARVKKGSAAIDVKLNPVYIRDALKCVSGEEVKLEFVNNTRPVVIQEDGILCFICPMKP